MRLFGKRTKPADGGRSRGSCQCREHVGQLLGLDVPVASAWASEGPVTVRELLAAVWVDGWQYGADLDAVEDPSDALLSGYTHYLELGDEVRLHYDDEAPLALDTALVAQPGVEDVAWEDREVLHVRAPTMCAEGVMAALVRALQDPRVRVGQPTT